MIAGAVDTEFAVRLWKKLGEAPHRAQDVFVHVRLSVSGRERVRRLRHLSASVPALLAEHSDFLPAHPHPLLVNVRAWACLAVNAHLVFRTASHGAWLRALSIRLGRLQGFISMRYFAEPGTLK